MECVMYVCMYVCVCMYMNMRVCIRPLSSMPEGFLGFLDPRASIEFV